MCRSCWQGFALGLVVGAIGPPRRLARQLFGITEGFFSPLFFVWLGASLHVRDLGSHPQFILLGVGLGVGAVLAHCAGWLLGQPLTLAFCRPPSPVCRSRPPQSAPSSICWPPPSRRRWLGALVAIASTSVAGVPARARSAAAR